MSERLNPDYVDRCIDFISSGRKRCVADLVLGAIIAGFFSAASLHEHRTDTPNRPWTERHREFVETRQPCKMDMTGLRPSVEGHKWSGDLRECLNS